MTKDFPEPFSRQYETHLKHLKLKGLQPKTIDAYARATRRLGGARPEITPERGIGAQNCRISPSRALMLAPPDHRIGQPAHLRAGIQKAICRELRTGLVQQPVQIVAAHDLTLIVRPHILSHARRVAAANATPQANAKA